MQIEDTHHQLERLGHTVVRIEAAPAQVALDLVHAFGSEPDNWQRVRNWRRSRVPLVVTPVISISTRSQRLALRLGARLPLVMSSARMRRELLTQANVVVALTEYERGLVLNELGIERSKVRVIGSGVDVPPPRRPDALADDLDDGDGFVLMVGRVNAWKRQAAVLEAIGDRVRIVVAGELEDEATGPAWEALLERSRAVWVGSVERAELAYLYDQARALVHLSIGEVQSLAVMEALSRGTRVIASNIPAHQELARRHGAEWIRIVERPDQVAAAIEALEQEDAPPARPNVPTTREVARELERLYEIIAQPGRTDGAMPEAMAP